jgi:hypothetical protein
LKRERWKGKTEEYKSSKVNSLRRKRRERENDSGTVAEFLVSES